MWCSLKEFQRINPWAQENPLRSLRRFISQGTLPFKSRCNVSTRNTKRYEIYITDPSEIARLLKIRENKMFLVIPETTSEAPKDVSKKVFPKRVRVTLPKRLASLVNTPGYHLLLLDQLSTYIRHIEQTHAEFYQRVQINIPDNTFQLLQTFAERNRLPIANATQIILSEVLTGTQIPMPGPGTTNDKNPQVGIVESDKEAIAEGDNIISVKII
jgi:hypothetical protein